MIGSVQATDEGTLRIEQDATVSFDTHFNALFERHWRLYTRASALTLSLQVEGRAVVRVWRRSSDTGCVLVHEQEVGGRVRIALPMDAPHYRQAGLLWFDLTALDGPAVLKDANWSTPDAGQPPARLGVVICTFNREPELAAVLAAIAGSEDLGTAVARVIVVNQGRPELAAQPGIRGAAARLGPRLRVVEQANLGGAGGFGRGVLEALDDPAITHVCLLDDDVRVEPESLRRMAAFFTLAQDGLALGGHMLDSVRPTNLYEAGAVVLPNWEPRPLHHGLDLREPWALDRLLNPGAMHFSGWWMAVLPLGRLLIQLLTYRYYSAALIVRAVEDSPQGPAILDQDPRPLHASLAELRQRYPDAWTRQERVPAAAPVGASLRFRLGSGLAMARALLTNWTRASPANAPPQALQVHDLVWFRVTQSDCLAVDTHWDRDFSTLRRSRASFRHLLSRRAARDLAAAPRRTGPAARLAGGLDAPHVAVLLARLRLTGIAGRLTVSTVTGAQATLIKRLNSLYAWKSSA